MKFSSFMHLCTTLCDYHNLVSSHDAKYTSSQVKKSKPSTSKNSQPFQKPKKGFLQFNPPQQPTQPINNQVTTVKAAIPFTYGNPKIKFTPLPDTLHNTMSQLLQQKMITLPIVKPLDPTNPLPPTFQPNAYCHYHRQNGHDTK